jgi:hypothetical protein
MDIVTILSTVATVAAIVGTAMYKLGDKLARIEKDIEALRSGFNRLANVITNTNEITIEYLGLRGILNQGGVGFLRTVIKNLASTATTNPLTEAERKRLLELVDKDDLTIEEAEELYRLARKLYREYIEKTPDAAYALLYAVIKRVEAYARHGGQQTQPPKTQS